MLSLHSRSQIGMDSTHDSGQVRPSFSGGNRLYTAPFYGEGQYKNPPQSVPLPPLQDVPQLVPPSPHYQLPAMKFTTATIFVALSLFSAVIAAPVSLLTVTIEGSLDKLLIYCPQTNPPSWKREAGGGNPPSWKREPGGGNPPSWKREPGGGNPPSWRREPGGGNPPSWK